MDCALPTCGTMAAFMGDPNLVARFHAPRVWHEVFRLPESPAVRIVLLSATAVRPESSALAGHSELRVVVASLDWEGDAIAAARGPPCLPESASRLLAGYLRDCLSVEIEDNMPRVLMGHMAWLAPTVAEIASDGLQQHVCWAGAGPSAGTQAWHRDGIWLLGPHGPLSGKFAGQPHQKHAGPSSEGMGPSTSGSRGSWLMELVAVWPELPSCRTSTVHMSPQPMQCAAPERAGEATLPAPAERVGPVTLYLGRSERMLRNSAVRVYMVAPHNMICFAWLMLSTSAVCTTAQNMHDAVNFSTIGHQVEQTALIMAPHGIFKSSSASRTVIALARLVHVPKHSNGDRACEAYVLSRGVLVLSH